MTTTQPRAAALARLPLPSPRPGGPLVGTTARPVSAHANTHPRTLGWVGATALAIGGSNQSLFLITALVATQGSAAIPLLVVGLLLSWAALPGWTELTLMWPDRVGGIAATCAEAFRPYSPVLANLTGVCYWWGWVPTCGLTALLSASALHHWYLPFVGTTPLAIAIVVGFTVLNLLGVSRVTRVVTVMAVGSGVLAFLSAFVPIVSGNVDVAAATAWDLTTPFSGVFGGLTSAMAGLYLIGFAAPAFEAAACHVGEMKDPVRNLPRAMIASGGMAGLYFLVLPVVWLGVLGADGLNVDLGADLAQDLGPTFAPLFGSAAKGLAIWFMVLNMFHGTVQPLAGASRTLSQLAEDGLLPRLVERRNRRDVPWVATLLTATLAIAFLLAGDPVWLIAAANFTYLIGIGLPSVAVWLLRRNQPERHRPWRAPRGTIVLGLIAAGAWFVSTVLGFRQFGMPTVLFGLALAYSGSAFYAWRSWSDRRRDGTPRVARSLHFKLTGAMLVVMVLDGAGYALAVASVGAEHQRLVVVLEDIFVAVAILTISVGLVLPGMIAHAVIQVAEAATRLSRGTLAELTRAMDALGRGDLEQARARPVDAHVAVQTRDEVGMMASAFNDMQDEVARAASSLDSARGELQRSRTELEHLASHDSLTGLPNRRRLETEIERIVTDCRRTSTPGAVLLIDLDGFKYINDSRGHATGDMVLMKVATLLRGQLRPEDVLGRLGGDEFAAVLPDTDAEGAFEVVHRLLDALRSAVVVVQDGKALRITASVGIAPFGPDQPATARDLLVDADVALYDAKDAGRDRVAMSSSADPRQSDLRQRHTWLERIREALEDDSFVLHAQPILDLHGRPGERYELLLRMIDCDGGVILPGTFLPVAERSGLIAQIDRWVVRAACAMLADAQRAGMDVRFEVNLSGLSLGDDAMLALLESELAALPRPEGLIIEVTETAAVVDVPRARAFAERLNALGCEFALDDFGAGYGSFYYLKHLPFDYLKIDGEFIRGVVANHADQVVVRSLVEIARELGKETVAEFVEDQETLDMLVALGVDHAQGYHVGRPAPWAPAHLVPAQASRRALPAGARTTP